MLHSEEEDEEAAEGVQKQHHRTLSKLSCQSRKEAWKLHFCRQRNPDQIHQAKRFGDSIGLQFTVVPVNY